MRANSLQVSTFQYPLNLRILSSKIRTCKNEAKNNLEEKAKDTPDKLILEKNLLTLKKVAFDLQKLNEITNLLIWDIDLNMPSSAASNRAAQMAFLTKIYHECLISREVLDLLSFFSDENKFELLSDKDKALIRELKEQYANYKNVPTKLLEEYAEVVHLTEPLWLEADTMHDFSRLIPNLEKIVSLNKEKAKYIGYKDSPYDALLKSYNPDMSSKEMDELFLKLKEELFPFCRKIISLSINIDNSFITKDYDLEKQKKIANEVLNLIGFDFERGRVDAPGSPSSSGIDSNDVRLTNILFKDNILYTFATILHEGGHGLYNQGIDSELSNTLLFDAPSISFHESQSRLYETMVGHRLPFWEFYFPKLKSYFPNELKDVTLEQFYKGVNKVEPSACWAESDEIMYNVHVIISYEIEKALIEGKLEVKDIPTYRAKKLQEYAGIKVDNFEVTSLIHSHWTSGYIGYFPAYTLGTLYAAQIYNTIKKEIPDIEEKISNGDFDTLRNWLKEKIHKHGKTYTPKELIVKVTGEPLNPKYFIDYVKDKYSKLYGL